MDDLIAALDIGTTKICVVIARKKADGLEAVGVGHAKSYGLNRGVITNIDQTVTAIRKAVEEAEVMAGVEVKSLHVGIAGGQIEGINSRGVVAISGKNGPGEITLDDITRVINTAQSVSIPSDREIIHVIPQEFTVDDQSGIIDPLGMSGVRLEVEVHLVTCLKSATTNIRKTVQRAGYEVADIILQPIASAEAVLHADERELGVMVIDIGGGTTDVLLYIANSIWYTHVVPLGGNNVTKDISFGLRTPQTSAELIKQQHGAAMESLIDQNDYISIPLVGEQRPPVKVSRRMIAKIIEPRMEEIFNMVRDSVEKTGYMNKIAAGVVITGGAAQCEGLVALAEKIFNQPVRLGQPIGVSGLSEKVASPVFSTAVGLARFEAHLNPEGNTASRSVKTADGGGSGRMAKRIKEFFGEFFG